MIIKTIENENPRIFLLIGAPFSGKSRIANELAIKYNATIVSKPEIKKILFFNNKNKRPASKKVFNVMMEMVYDLIVTNRNVIIDGTFITTKQREKLLKIIKALSNFETYFNTQSTLHDRPNSSNIMFYKIIGVYIKPDIKKAVKRNEEANYPIGIYTLEEHYNNFDKPFIEEGFDKIIVKKSK